MLLLLVALLLADARSAPLQDTKPASKSHVDPETIEELKSDEHPMIQGDIVQTADRNAVGRAWPTLEIPYQIHPGLAGRTDDVLAAMAMVSKDTCVTFHPRTTERDYLLFTTSKGCASYVGFIGGEQRVFVGPGCGVGNVAHEVLHALGFHHEHTRTDRQQYITVVSENILSGKEKNFKQHEGETFNLPYDIASILHYGSDFFSANGLPTIIAKKDSEDMGQRVRLTETDVHRVQQLYNCDALMPPKKRETVTFLSDAAAAHSNVTAPEPSHAPPSAASALQRLTAASRGRPHAAPSAS